MSHFCCKFKFLKLKLFPDSLLFKTLTPSSLILWPTLPPGLTNLNLRYLRMFSHKFQPFWQYDFWDKYLKRFFSNYPLVHSPSQLWQFITPWDHDLNKLAFTLPEHDSTQVSTFQPINLEKNIVKHFFSFPYVKFHIPTAVPSLSRKSCFEQTWIHTTSG